MIQSEATNRRAERGKREWRRVTGPLTRVLSWQSLLRETRRPFLTCSIEQCSEISWKNSLSQRSVRDCAQTRAQGRRGVMNAECLSFAANCVGVRYFREDAWNTNNQGVRRTDSHIDMLEGLIKTQRHFCYLFTDWYSYLWPSTCAIIWLLHQCKIWIDDKF